MSSDGEKVKELVDGIRTAMLTNRGGHGLCGRPLTVQRVDDDGTVWFLVDRHADWVAPDLGEVNLSFVDDPTWVSATGQARVLMDSATIDDLGDPISDTWFADEAEPAALRVEIHHADWWSAPGKLRQVLNIAGGVITRHEPDMGDRGVAEP